MTISQQSFLQQKPSSLSQWNNNPPSHNDNTGSTDSTENHGNDNELNDNKIVLAWLDETLQQLEERGHNGDTNAQYILGKCYETGHHPDSLPRAARWYFLAAFSGHCDAQFALAECYFHGRGVEQNYNAAVQWYSQALPQYYLQQLPTVQQALEGEETRESRVDQVLQAHEENNEDFFHNLLEHWATTTIETDEPEEKEENEKEAEEQTWQGSDEKKIPLVAQVTKKAATTRESFPPSKRRKKSCAKKKLPAKKRSLSPSNRKKHKRPAKKQRLAAPQSTQQAQLPHSPFHLSYQTRDFGKSRRAAAATTAWVEETTYNALPGKKIKESFTSPNKTFSLSPLVDKSFTFSPFVAPTSPPTVSSSPQVTAETAANLQHPKRPYLL